MTDENCIFIVVDPRWRRQSKAALPWPRQTDIGSLSPEASRECVRALQGRSRPMPVDFNPAIPRGGQLLSGITLLHAATNYGQVCHFP